MPAHCLFTLETSESYRSTDASNIYTNSRSRQNKQNFQLFPTLLSEIQTKSCLALIVFFLDDPRTFNQMKLTRWIISDPVATRFSGKNASLREFWINFFEMYHWITLLSSHNSWRRWEISVLGRENPANCQVDRRRSGQLNTRHQNFWPTAGWELFSQSGSQLAAGTNGEADRDPVIRSAGVMLGWHRRGIIERCVRKGTREQCTVRWKHRWKLWLVSGGRGRGRPFH